MDMGIVVAGASTTRAIPQGALAPRINLWPYAHDGEAGLPPSNGCDVEIAVSSFGFTPNME